MEKISRRDFLTGITGVLGGMALGCSQTESANKEVKNPTTVPITPEMAYQVEEARMVLDDSISSYADNIREIGLKKGITPNNTKLSNNSESSTYKFLDPEDKTGYELAIVSDPNQTPTQIIFTHLKAINEENPSLRKYQEYTLSCSDKLIGFSIQDGGFIEDQMVPMSLRLIQIGSGEAIFSVRHYPESISDGSGDSPLALADQTQERIELDDVFRRDDLFAGVTSQIDQAITELKDI